MYERSSHLRLCLIDSLFYAVNICSPSPSQCLDFNRQVRWLRARDLAGHLFGVFTKAGAGVKIRDSPSMFFGTRAGAKTVDSTSMFGRTGFKRSAHKSGSTGRGLS